VRVCVYANVRASRWSLRSGERRARQGASDRVRSRSRSGSSLSLSLFLSILYHPFCFLRRRLHGINVQRSASGTSASFDVSVLALLSGFTYVYIYTTLLRTYTTLEIIASVTWDGRAAGVTGDSSTDHETVVRSDRRMATIGFHEIYSRLSAGRCLPLYRYVDGTHFPHSLASVSTECPHLKAINKNGGSPGRGESVSLPAPKG
jgi:hypothetical protein